jgi:hypothetical protein
VTKGDGKEMDTASRGADALVRQLQIAVFGCFNQRALLPHPEQYKKAFEHKFHLNIAE